MPQRHFITPHPSPHRTPHVVPKASLTIWGGVDTWYSLWGRPGLDLGGRRSIRRIYRITGYPDNRINPVLIRKGVLSAISARAVRADRPYGYDAALDKEKTHFGTFPDKPKFGLQRSPDKMPSQICRINKFPDTPDILRLPRWFATAKRCLWPVMD